MSTTYVISLVINVALWIVMFEVDRVYVNRVKLLSRDAGPIFWSIRAGMFVTWFLLAYFMQDLVKCVTTVL